MWRSITGYEGIYEVSNSGEIRGLDRVNSIGERVRGRPIKLSTIMGYPYFNACKNGKPHPIYVHHAVAEAFIGKRPNGHEINHKDGNKRNNRVDNLEYVTPSENMIHAIRTGLNIVPRPDNRGSRHGMSKLTETDVLDIKHLLKLGNGVCDIARKHNISSSVISEIKSGKLWRHVK